MIIILLQDQNDYAKIIHLLSFHIRVFNVTIKLYFIFTVTSKPLLCFSLYLMISTVTLSSTYILFNACMYSYEQCLID